MEPLRPGILTLTSDFGADGPYVAAMKGVILTEGPGLYLVDVSHAIAPQNVLEGAFVLSGIVDAFPPGTVHLAVVDPGVGTERRLVAVRVADQWFVLPDNGLITGVARERTIQEARVLDNPAIRRAVVSATFHGRDVLAPVASYLARGGNPAELGPEAGTLVRLANFTSRPDGDGLIGEVIYRDTFGNLITNVRGDELDRLGPDVSWSIEVGGETIKGLRRTYGEQASGSLVALVGGSGWLEVAVVNGDASRHLGAGAGATIWVRRAESSRGT